MQNLIFTLELAKPNSTAGLTVEPVFAVRLHDKYFNILNQLQAYFNGIGKIYHFTDKKNEAAFRVGSIKEL